MKRFLVPVLFLALLAGGVGGSLLMMPSSAQVSSLYSLGPRSTTFAALGAPANGQHRWCSDCQSTSPCTSGGSGSMAFRVGGAWNCTSGAGGAAPAGSDGQLQKKSGSDLAAALLSESGSNMTLNGNLLPNAAGTRSLGATTLPWSGLTLGGASNQRTTLSSIATNTRTATFPDANTAIPVFSHHHTFTGTSAARTVTLPDADFTAARANDTNIFSGLQTFAGHVGGSGSAPSCAVGGAAGAGATCSVSGNDSFFELTVETGTSTSAFGTFATVTFATAYVNPVCVASPSSAASANFVGAFVNTAGASVVMEFLGFGADPDEGASYKWMVFCGERS